MSAFANNHEINSQLSKELSKHSTRDARNFVMECTLNIERSITEFLAMRLSIDVNNNESLDKIGFDQKVRLLCDIRMISSEERSKLNALMQIRNKFAHEFYCNSFKNAIESIKGQRTFLERTYISSINKEVEEEEWYEEKFCLLYDDILQIMKKVFSQVMKHLTDEQIKEVNVTFLNMLSEELGAIKNHEHRKSISKIWDNAIKKFNQKEWQGFSHKSATS